MLYVVEVFICSPTKYSFRNLNKNYANDSFYFCFFSMPPSYNFNYTKNCFHTKFQLSIRPNLANYISIVLKKFPLHCCQLKFYFSKLISVQDAFHKFSILKAYITASNHINTEVMLEKNMCRVIGIKKRVFLVNAARTNPLELRNICNHKAKKHTQD